MTLVKIDFPEEWPDSLRSAFLKAYEYKFYVKVTHKSGLSEAGYLEVDWRGTPKIRNKNDDYPNPMNAASFPLIGKLIRITRLPEKELNRNESEVIWDLERDEPILWVHSQ